MSAVRRGVRDSASAGAVATTAGAGREVGTGWALAVAAAASFGIAGSFATPLIHAGWSPGAVVVERVTIAALALLVPAIRTMRGRWNLLRMNVALIVSYGLVAIAASQLFYFSALATLDVGVALLLEYTGIVMVVLWLWLRHGQRPHRLTLAGAAVAMIGLVLVLNLAGGGVRLHAGGVLWGLGAAVCLAAHYLLSARPAHGLPPLVLAASGMTIGAAALWLAGLARIMPLHTVSVPVRFAGVAVPWWVPILGVGLISAAFAYVAAIGAARVLGSTLASFAGLAEVLFAILFAWLLLGQLPTWVQLLGGALIVLGVVLVRTDEAARQRAERRIVGVAHPPKPR